MVYHSDVGFQGVPISGKLIVSERLLEDFARWLREQRVSEKTIKGHYLSYLRRLVGFSFSGKRDVERAFRIMGFNKTSYEALSRFLTFAEKKLEGYEWLVYVLRKAMPSKPRSETDTYIPPDMQVLEAREKAARIGEPYITLWNILVASGCRLVEAIHLIRTYSSRREVKVTEEIIRYHLDLQRKSKREYVMYIPAWLKNRILAVKKIPGYNTLRDRFRRNIMPPKYLRKWFRQKLKQHRVDPELIEFLQGRLLNIGMKHYTDFIILADKQYPEEIYPKIKPYLIENTQK